MRLVQAARPRLDDCLGCALHAGLLIGLNPVLGLTAEHLTSGDAVEVAVGDGGAQGVVPAGAPGLVGELRTEFVEPDWLFYEGGPSQMGDSLLDGIASGVEGAVHLLRHGDGWFGDESGDQAWMGNALAETVNGLYKAECADQDGPFASLADVMDATLDWVRWYNSQRLHEYLDYTTPDEAEAEYYSTQQPLENQ